jgi:hypothetical protein
VKRLTIDLDAVYDRREYAHTCPFFEAARDQDGDAEDWGECAHPDRLGEQGWSGLCCPVVGPRGGVKTHAPEECPLRERATIICAKGTVEELKMWPTKE